MKKLLAIFLLGSILLMSGCQAGENTKSEKNSANISLAPKPLAAKEIDQNPYMADSESNIHNDCYNSDSTDAILPLGIYSEVNTSLETESLQAPPAIFYDEYGNAISPILGGMAIRDLNSDIIETLGSFIPSLHDNEKYSIQSSYSFVDSDNNIVCPTSHNHVLILKSTDENGKPLEVFEKLVDINIKETAENVLGKTIDQNLLSVVFDYQGNLWFATGGFRIYPDRQQTGIIGYIDGSAIESLKNGNSDLNIEDYVYVYETEPGEGAENGIASSKDGCIILTNKACYLLNADNGVNVLWRTEYESSGANDSSEEDKTTGGGLAWGGGSSPTLTNDYVIFTDNLDPINVIALDIKTGEKAASTAVFGNLAENQKVSVENSVIVYDGTESVSIVVCNWFGAGSAKLAQEDSDSSIQSYDNIYDSNWIQNGNEMIMPGIERVDIVKTENGVEMKTVWSRNDISSTSIFKLSTATGYLYGYDQDLETKMWRYIILDFDTGETVYTKDVSSLYGYNNMAIGMYTGGDGNTLYCPTGYMELLRLQDRFVYLPEMPYRDVDLDLAERHTVTDKQLSDAGVSGAAASYMFTATVDNAHPSTTIAFRANGIEGSTEGLSLYICTSDGKLEKASESIWQLKNSDGSLNASDIYEIHVSVDDNSSYDIDETEKRITLSVVLVKEQ